ncbi:MAG: uroporphyrinogen-III synthase [Bacteroidetes bacterium]|nr:uroporphyrinogen-III synthase [Bacteroidota bacterium]
MLKRAGISVLNVPMIRIEGVEKNDEITAALENLHSYDAILLTSMNAVRFFAARLREAEIEPDMLPPVFVVGPKTASVARREGFSLQTLPSESYGATLAEELPDVRERRFLQPCSQIVREEAAVTIRERGGSVDQLVVYRTLPPTEDDAARLEELVKTAAYDSVAFFSPSAVRHYAELLPEETRPSVTVAAIGRTTAAEAAACGIEVDIIPSEQTAESLAEAIVGWTR